MDAAKRLRLRAKGDRASGRVDGLAVEVSHVRGELAVSVEAKLVLAPTLELENIGEHWAPTIKSARVATGDVAFDSRFAAAGGEDEVLAALDRETRALLLDLIAHSDRARLKLSEGVLRFRAAVPFLEQIVRTLVRIARRLATEGTFLPARMMENIAHETNATVRRKIVRRLVEHHWECDESREALAIAARERDPETLLFAARHLGREALDPLKAVAEMKSADPELRITAIGELVVKCPAKDAGAVLARVIALPPLDVQLVALEHLGALKSVEALPKLAKVAARAKPELAIAIARTLVAIGSPEAEPTLIAMLERDEPEVKLVAADALIWCGGAASLELLTAIPSRGKPSVKLVARAKEAAARIRARIGPAEQGRLSLARPAAGQGALSTPSVEAGALAVVRAK